MKKSTRRKHYLQKIHRHMLLLESCGIIHNGECPFCGSNELFYYFRYDAECCLSCDEWLSIACEDPNCKYCAKRPPTPSMALIIEKPLPYDRKERLRQNYSHKISGYIRRKNRRK